MAYESTIVADMIEAAARRNESDKRCYLGMSVIGVQCWRKLWYNFRGFTAKRIDGRAQMIFDFGNLIEESVIKWIKDAGYLITDQQREFTDYNGWFKGHCDGYIHGLSEIPSPWILEIKSASDSRFKAIKSIQNLKESVPVYWAQVQCYMHYAELNTALVIVINKNNCELYTEEVREWPAECDRLLDKAQQIIYSDIEFDRDITTECDYCEYKDLCGTNTTGTTQLTKNCGTCKFLKVERKKFMCDKVERQINHIDRFCDGWTYKFADCKDVRETKDSRFVDIDKVPF